ncbi:hypothetical protein M885DRAFT_507388 [Pelagophyceae sp. CCMP2097]|nr:hypothetical protein M885DRAFT_507388 [Pelagophyceae sp. CCMP2097]
MRGTLFVWLVAWRCRALSALSSPLNRVESKLVKSKRLLLASVSAGAQADILANAATLEVMSMSTAPVSGIWTLVYSTQTAGPSPANPNALGDLPQRIQDFIYENLFRYLPFLAGGQDRKGGAKSLVTVANSQLVDIKNGRVDNTVDVQTQWGAKLRIRVEGTAAEVSKGDESKLTIVFESFSFGVVGSPFPMLTLPLPRPRGLIETTFVDDDLRLSRGSRGGIFVLKRQKGTSR